MPELETHAVDLVIPARNESLNIPALFDALAALPEGTLRHVVVADNGSTDDTAALARERGAVVVSESQPGYGAACLAGLAWIAEQATPPAAVGFLDADLADDPAELPTLIAPILRGEADFVLGSRPKLAEAGALDPHQRFGNWLACSLLRATCGKRYSDLGPMRVLRWDTLQALSMQDRTWGWTVEMQFKAAKQKLRVLEIDVPYRCRHAGKSKISGSIVGSARAGTKIIGTVASLTLRG